MAIQVNGISEEILSRVSIFIALYYNIMMVHDKYSIEKDKTKTYPRQQPFKEKLLPQMGLESTTFSVLG